MGATVGDALTLGADGLARCWWAATTADYVAYHDEEWGVPVHGDVAVFERISLEAFQSGLSWLTILRKRAHFRVAFDGFDIETVASYGPGDEARLLADTGIVRNRAKVAATIANARAAAEMRADAGEGALDRLVWSVAPDPRQRPTPRTRAEVPVTSPESVELARVLKRRGFVFVGPTTAYAAMQAMGLVDDHVLGCHARARHGHGGPASRG